MVIIFESIVSVLTVDNYQQTVFEAKYCVDKEWLKGIFFKIILRDNVVRNYLAC